MIPRSLSLVFAGLLFVSGCTSKATDKQPVALETLHQLEAAIDFDDQDQVKFVNLSHRSVTDEQLQCVEELANLRQLWLYDTAVTDRGLRHLRRLVNLEVLVLGKTRITDQGLPELDRLRNLKELYLYDTDVSAPAVHRLQVVLRDTLIVY